MSDTKDDAGRGDGAVLVSDWLARTYLLACQQALVAFDKAVKEEERQI
jgi:hypothetical protein